MRLGEWYDRIQELGGETGEIVDWLDGEHDERIETLAGMPKRTLDSVWWPFTQHGLVHPLSCKNVDLDLWLTV